MPKYIKITVDGSSCINTLGEAIEMLQESYDNDHEVLFDIKTIEMTEEKFKNLPEFMGF